MNEGLAASKTGGWSKRRSRWLSYGAIAALGLLSLSLYWLIFRPMTHEVLQMETNLERIHRQIAETGFGHPESPGAYLMDVESKMEKMQELADTLSGRITFHSGLEDLLASPFRVLEFEQRRFDIQQSLRQLAEARASSLPADFLSGLPSYYTTTEEQQFLWLHLEFFNHTMMALLSSGRNLQVEQVESLPVRTLGKTTEAEGSLLQVRLRLKVRGPAAALATFLNASLPGNADEDSPVEKKAYTIDRLDLRSITNNGDGQVTLDTRLTGFILSEQTF